MDDLHRLNSDALVDILSKQTAAYLQMQTEGGSVEEFTRCKLLLRAIQKELNQRNNKNSNATVANDDTLSE